MDKMRIRRAIYRAWHRGFREADLILGPFAEDNCDGMSEAELALFERLLEVPDHDLYGWIIERDAPDPQFEGDLLNRLRAFRHTLFATRGDQLGA